MTRTDEATGQATAAVAARVEPTTLEKLRGLKWSIASNAANTVFTQYTFFGSIFVLFLSALGLSKGEMGFLLALIPFFGLIALFVAPWVERYGVKRSYLTFFGLRNLAAACLLFTPLVLARYGVETTLTFIAITIAVFSMLRAVGVTASYPWVQEYVPNSVRGKYTAVNNITATTTGFVAVLIGGWVLGHTPGLTGFMLLIGVAIAFGLLSVGIAFLIPGGAPRPAAQTGSQTRGMRDALGDGDFNLYLIAVGLITLATVPLGSFLPLFMREEVGLTESGVVWLQTGTLLGSLLSSYLWGWAADRYGSAPVTLYGLGMRAMLPFFWMFMPRDSAASLYIALAIAFLQGVADMGWGIGSGRLLYVNIVPAAKRTSYMALYYAWVSVTGGLSQLGGGRLLEVTQNLSGQVWVFTIDPYFPLFVLNIILPIGAFFLLRRVQQDEGIGMREFAGNFLRGNPFLAFTSMIRFHMAHDEHATVLSTERLGQAKSPLTVDELLEALEDPRFNVRFEAVISIGRMHPDPRLIQALEEILNGSELALTVVAAWALGRLGDKQAIESLRDSLDSNYRSIRGHSARALGALGDKEITPELLARLESEQDKGLQMAYASALGNLCATEAVPQLLELLATTSNPGARLELALSLARLVGDEHQFIHLLRSVRGDPGTAMSQAVSAYRKKAEKAKVEPAVLAQLDATADQLARGDLVGGEQALGEVIRHLPPEEFTSTGAAILAGCAAQLAQPEPSYDHALLALHTLQAGARG